MAVDCSAPLREPAWVSRTAIALRAWPLVVCCSPGTNEPCVSLTDISRQTRKKEPRMAEASFFERTVPSNSASCFSFPFSMRLASYVCSDVKTITSFFPHPHLLHRLLKSTSIWHIFKTFWWTWLNESQESVFSLSLLLIFQYNLGCLLDWNASRSLLKVHWDQGVMCGQEVFIKITSDFSVTLLYLLAGKLTMFHEL
jgi:hypothetical protein